MDEASLKLKALKQLYAGSKIQNFAVNTPRPSKYDRRFHSTRSESIPRRAAAASQFSSLQRARSESVSVPSSMACGLELKAEES